MMVAVRIGELLVSAGLIELEQVHQILRAQVMWGGRFGTCAVEMHLVDLDVLSRVIGRQHGLPAAYAKHFDAADPELQHLVSPELAAQYDAIPLRRINERVIVASMAPLDGRARALIADQLGISYKAIIPAVAAELRIRYHLERVYGITRESRFLRARRKGPSAAPLRPPTFGDEIIDPAPPRDLLLDDAIPEEVLPDPSSVTQASDPTAERRRYIKMLGDDDSKPIARIELKRHASAQMPAIADSIEDATRAIGRVTDRDALAKQLIATVARFVPARAGVLLVIRGDAATTWTGFPSAPEIAVPLDEVGLVPLTIHKRTMARVAAGDLGAIDSLLLESLDAPHADLVVAPIAIGEAVWCVLALAMDRDASTETLEPITAAASAGFARLMQHANR